LTLQSDARALNLSQVFDNLGRLTLRSWSQPDRFNPATPISLTSIRDPTKIKSKKSHKLLILIVIV
jgi:hypothetical protein